MDNEKDTSHEITARYDDFLSASDFTPSLNSFYKLCDILDINPKNHKTVFTSLKSKLKLWKCQTLFNKLEKKGKHKDYSSKPCAKLKVLIIGAGPVGLRTAIEAAYLGAYVVVVEKRSSYSRNNVLHLWPFLIVDLKSLGVKSFFGKFCAGSLDHICIRRLQCILLKVCLLVGVQVHSQITMEDLIECSEDKGWRVNFKPGTSPLNLVEFDAIVGCDGKNNGLKFKRKEFRGKLAIAITCNFVNKRTSEEARVEEISGVAFIYNQEFFHQLYEKTGIELENIVYYKDETHYFVMTAKKKSLLNKGVIKQDSKDVFKLLSMENINHKKLCDFGRESADFATKYQLPHHEFAVNHYGKEDVALFDFTSIHQAENASKIIERKGKRLLLCIAGDILLEPFWPTGSGCARGFLGGMDAAWMIRRLGLGDESIDMIQERESIFTLLPQTKPDSLLPIHENYSINPATRYCNLNVRKLTQDQVRNLYDCSNSPVHLYNICMKTESNSVSKPIEIKPPEIDPDILLEWCKKQTKHFLNVNVTNLSTSWKNGLAFCAIISHYLPELIDYSALNPSDIESNCRKAFSVAEEHLGIPPKISAHDFATQRTPDTLAIMAYVSLYYEALKSETPAKKPEKNKEFNDAQISASDGEVPLKLAKISSKMSIISKLSRNNKRKKLKLSKIGKSNKENKIIDENSVTIMSYERSPGTVSGDTSCPTLSNLNEDKKNSAVLKTKENEESDVDKYKRISQLAETVFGDTIIQMGSQLNQRKVEKSDILAESEKCYFCHRKVFVMERQSAEGLFFHRKCFRCFICKCQLLLGNYAFHVDGEDRYNEKFFCKMHYNRIIYEAEKNNDNNTAEKNRPCSALYVSRNADDVHRLRTATIGDLNSPISSKVTDIQIRLQGNIADVNLLNGVANNNKKEYLDGTNELDNINSKLNTKSPYDKLAARKLDRHPSLLKCGARKVTTNSFFTASKHSISTPNLSKLIQEDSMFEKEREEHATDNILTDKPFESTKSPEIITVANGAVDRRPMNERRAQYPVSMAFADGIVNAAFRHVSVDIDLGESTLEIGNKDEERTFAGKPKKKRLALKKKKKLIPGKELSEKEKLIRKIPDNTTENIVDISHKHTKLNMIGECNDHDIQQNKSNYGQNLYDNSSSEDEMPSNIIKKKFGKKEKKQLAKEQEVKKKSKEDKKIKKEMKAREMKRLWEAQSIQRKINEVDVKQYELETKAKQVEKDLHNETHSPEKINHLMFEWFTLVNEKNILLRFESELVIAANSIQLEDRQARLEQEIRTLLKCTNPKLSSHKEIERLTKEHVDTVVQRNALVEMLEEDRIRELEEDKCLNVTFSKKAHDLGMDRLI